jgi:hypothetical protein
VDADLFTNTTNERVRIFRTLARRNEGKIKALTSSESEITTHFLSLQGDMPYLSMPSTSRLWKFLLVGECSSTTAPEVTDAKFTVFLGSLGLGSSSSSVSSTMRTGCSGAAAAAVCTSAAAAADPGEEGVDEEDDDAEDTDGCDETVV